MYANQQSAGYAPTPNSIGPVSSAEIPSLLDNVCTRVAELEKSLIGLVERLHPVMRQDAKADMPPQAPRAVANTQVGSRLDDVDRQLSFLRDSVGTIVSRLEV